MVEPPLKTRMTEIRSREHNAAQSVRPADVNRPEITFAGCVASCG